MQKQSKRRMKALVVTALGDPTAPLEDSVLKLTTQHPVPKLPAGHVRIRTVAASLNFADMLQVQGSYQVGKLCIQIASRNWECND
jgi:NADPH:quinone reductase-like Zn-dependent oxidoreductase